MTTRLMATTAIAVASSLAFSSCTRPPRSPTPPLRGGESYEIKDCKDKYVPKTVYKIKIAKSFELRDPQVVKSTVPANETTPGSGEYDEYYGSMETPYTWNSDARYKTRLDLDLGLTQKGDAAMIKIILDDPLLNFRTDGGVIRGGGPHGRDMICSVRRNIDEKSIRFIVFYYKEHQSDKNTYGKYNIGLAATDKDTSSGYVLPIYIDPMIKNNG
jgi:hypothetical protein